MSCFCTKHNKQRDQALWLGPNFKNLDFISGKKSMYKELNTVNCN